MSNLSDHPENAAIAAPVSPASPCRAAGSVSSETLAPPSHPRPDAPPTSPPAGVQDVSPVPVAPGAPGQQGPPAAAATLPSAPQASPSSGDQIKYHRGPAVLTRPHGPSLLTQALATARGIHPPSSRPELSHPPTKTPPAVPPQDQLAGLPIPESQQPPSRDLEEQESHNASAEPDDEDSLTPRASPRPGNAMPSSTVVATTVAYSPSKHYSMLDLGEVNSMLNGHRDFLTKSKGRGTSLERTDREKWAQDRSIRSGPFSHITANNGLVTPPFTESPSGTLHGGNTDTTVSSETGQDPRPRKPDHRLSMGPEKAWSISTGESAGCEDGQVEKSITEAISGAEPKERASRKASHSLRFFKEGNPDKEGKKKDSRAGQPRDKLAPTAEAPEADRTHRNTETGTPRPVPGADRGVPGTNKVGVERPVSSRLPSEVQPLSASPERVVPDKPGKVDVGFARPEELPSEAALTSPDRQVSDSQKLAPNLAETERKLDPGATTCEATEDGDESGEEKISSAVFLPHQGPDQSEEEEVPIPGVLPRTAPPSRTLSRHEDFHPWLVKAGEPENDDKTERADYERKLRSEPADIPSVAPKLDSRQADGSAIADESELGAFPPKLSRPVSQYQEETVHDHQWAPKQPLEAIELIPYKHQVGGHTTLWRFSRRAVCKQLNNRENEFYEKIEKYHRDLLAFLPRYIGVLNVTFQKKPRRKSTVVRDNAVAERSLLDQANGSAKANGSAIEDDNHASAESQAQSHQRVVSQSLQPPREAVPTVTFVDNQHILPRSLLQSPQTSPVIAGRYRSASASVQEGGLNGHVTPDSSEDHLVRPSIQAAHSWGATTVNKRLRNEVFNDAFLKRPIAIHRHRKGHHRAVPRRSIQQILRPTGSDPSLAVSREKETQTVSTAKEQAIPQAVTRLTQSHSDVSQMAILSDDEAAPKDVTGTSAPEPEILAESPAEKKKKRRYSGTGLRRKPKDVRDARGDLKYYEEADDVGYKSNKEDAGRGTPQKEFPQRPQTPQEYGFPDHGQEMALSTIPSSAASELPSPTAEFKKIPRPINPKEAQTQRDSRVEYFLLLEDLTAGMKRPCIMDLKMGTRQYGVDANPKKQQSQQGKCAKTTSRELGVRVCGLQVWDVKTQNYIFKDKYYGRDLKKGQEFQDALTRFLYDGVDCASILRHIPTVLQKLDQLEVIIARLRGYRFYAASLLMFYDGDVSEEGHQYDTAIEDSTTDFATDTEDAPRRTKRNKRDIDFKIADFANCITPGDLAKDKPCPPKHPNEPDRGFLRGLRSLRKYFLKIQRDTRAEMGLVGATAARGIVVEREEEDDKGVVSE
ncbi:hypothetical protein OQA88_12025 [Cercophora sp. LCS_1]